MAEPEARHRLRIRLYRVRVMGERSRRTREARSLETARIMWLLSYITFSTRGRRHSILTVTLSSRGACGPCGAAVRSVPLPWKETPPAPVF